MKKVKKLLIFAGVLILSVIILIFSVDFYVKNSTEDKVYESVSNIPKNRVGLVLGTSKKLNNGWMNLYYKYRIDAAVELYKAGKVEFLLVSGDNSRKTYDEPTTIKNDLIERGVPEDKIYLDYAGFRTLDSVVRSKAIFSQEKLTVISQEFHNRRALVLCRENDIDAVAFNAEDVSMKYGFKTKLREKLARVKMMLDILFGVDPKFYGKKIEIK
ncbi:SanA/YdcF family protein [Salibacter halophilus]|uniref:Vancomycin high temperature exclusion protein n=1 Tax=Salibacter halophilus TaxID=1803916 RepID=A0A6N6M7J5_9FLAO|nr:ElyC/SanA/YdcF family protein [Salibacter halophilus]KAB1064482.1 vancomycin high temperature exclusion protein [Salibacter halophilus]